MGAVCGRPAANKSSTKGVKTPAAAAASATPTPAASRPAGGLTVISADQVAGAGGGRVSVTAPPTPREGDERAHAAEAESASEEEAAAAPPSPVSHPVVRALGEEQSFASSEGGPAEEEVMTESAATAVGAGEEGFVAIHPGAAAMKTEDVPAR